MLSNLALGVLKQLLLLAFTVPVSPFHVLFQKEYDSEENA